MKIVLLNPPFYRFLGSHNNDSRLGLGYLSAILTRAGYDVQQYNADYLSSKDYASQKGLFEHSMDFADSVKKPYHPIYVDIFNTIDRLKPDIVGMTVMAGTVIQSEIIAKYCSDHGIRVIVGGTMVTLALSEMIKNPSFHQLVAGEAEKVIVQAVEHPERRIIVGTTPSDLNTLPFPQRNNFIGEQDEIAHGSIQTARGCQMRCKYCVNHLLGGEIRFRNPRNVVNEIEQLVKDYGVKNFRIFDDTFTVNKNRVFEICEEILKRRLNITFFIETRVDCLDREIIEALKIAGMNKAKLGIESGSERILKIYKPQYNKDKIRNVVSILKENDIFVSLNWMFGFPEETDADLQASIDFATELHGDWNTISSLAPYYGTDLFDELPEDKKNSWKGYFHTMKHPVMNDRLSETLITKFLDINNELGLER